MDGVTGLQSLGVKDLNYRLVFIANYVETSNNRFDLSHDEEDENNIGDQFT